MEGAGSHLVKLRTKQRQRETTSLVTSFRQLDGVSLDQPIKFGLKVNTFLLLFKSAQGGLSVTYGHKSLDQYNE